MVKVMFSNGEEMQSLAKRSPSMKPFLVKTYDSVFYEAVGRKIGIQGIKATQKVCKVFFLLAVLTRLFAIYLTTSLYSRFVWGTSGTYVLS